MQFAQDVIRHVADAFCLAIDVDRHVDVATAHFADERADVLQRRGVFGVGRELFIVDGKDEGTGAALLLGELAEVVVAGGAQDVEALGPDRLGERADAQSGSVLRTKILVDDDDGENEFHGVSRARAAPI
ncbi:hypothetical protein D3C71_1467740 [compost metagenome]